jgi:arsenical pump membrane protein
VLVVEYVGLRLLFRGDLAAPQQEHGEVSGPPVPVVPVVVVALMLVGFAVLSPWGVQPAWVSSAAALVLVVWAGVRGLVRPRDVARAGHPSFALLVLALGVGGGGVASGFLGDPGRAAGARRHVVRRAAGVAVLATLLASLLTNLSATILLVPMVAPARHHRGAVGAAGPQHRLGLTGTGRWPTCCGGAPLVSSAGGYQRGLPPLRS